MNARHCWILAVALAAAGCAHDDASRAAIEPMVKPGLVMLSADEAAHAGLALPGEPAAPAVPDGVSDAGSVLMPAGVRAYTVGRLVDPNDPNVMHEAHVLYRREPAPRWRLLAPASQQIMVGPRITDSHQELKPLLDQELNSYLADQRHAIDENRQTVAALFQAVDALTRQQARLAERLGSQTADQLPPAKQGGASPAASGADATEIPAADR